MRPPSTRTPTPAVPRSFTHRTRIRGWRAWIVRGLLVIVSALLSAELLGQAYLAYVEADWAALKKRSDHYFMRSDDPQLAYELKPTTSLTKEGRILRINRHGIRDASDDLHADRIRIALLGDSVTFGTGHSQNDTVSELVQNQLDNSRRRIRVLNFGVPGYGLDELAHYLIAKDSIYHVRHIVYILNANDFTRRDTVYEGADNGLYRMYRRPLLATPWILRKLVYRAHKGGSLFRPAPVSIDWYRWLFTDNRENGFARIIDMRDYCRERGIALTVVLLPAGSAYVNGRYELRAMYDELAAFCATHAVTCVDCTADFGRDSRGLFDSTDHLSRKGNEVMATAISRSLEFQSLSTRKQNIDK